jgi:hypothetical protein
VGDDAVSQTEELKKTSQLGALPLWSGIATIVGLASDFAQPIGPFALWLLIAFLIVSVASAIAWRSIPALKATAGNLAKYSIVGAIVFSLVVALQQFSGSEDAPGTELGFLAAAVPPVASAQSAIISVEPAAVDEFDAALRRAMREKDEIEKRAAARFALTSEDKLFRQTAIEKLYLSKDPALRRQAVIGIFSERQRSSLPIVVIEDEGNDPELAKSMNGKSLQIYSVDSEVGAVTGAIHYSVTGTIALSGITFAHPYGVYNLAAEDDFTIRGTYTNNEGAKVRIEILLN